MDLGFADATAVVTGGSKGMGRAVAEILAADGARVAVMARGREALDETAPALRDAGSPDAVGISVDMTDPACIDAGFSEVADRWGSLNILGAHDRTGRRAFRATRRRRLGRGVHTRDHVRRTERALRAAAAPRRRVGPDRHVLRALDPAAEPDPRRLHRVEGRGDQRRQEPGQVVAPEGILVNAVCPGTIVTASFTENLKDIFAAEGLDPADPHDVMTWIDRTFHQPADLGTGRVSRRGGVVDRIPRVPAERLRHGGVRECRRRFGLRVS